VAVRSGRGAARRRALSRLCRWIFISSAEIVAPWSALSRFTRICRPPHDEPRRLLAVHKEAKRRRCASGAHLLHGLP
jgi:hypothetical protein